MQLTPSITVVCSPTHIDLRMCGELSLPEAAVAERSVACTEGKKAHAPGFERGRVLVPVMQKVSAQQLERPSNKPGQRNMGQFH